MSKTWRLGHIKSPSVTRGFNRASLRFGLALAWKLTSAYNNWLLASATRRVDRYAMFLGCPTLGAPETQGKRRVANCRLAIQRYSALLNYQVRPKLQRSEGY